MVILILNKKLCCENAIYNHNHILSNLLTFIFICEFVISFTNFFIKKIYNLPFLDIDPSYNIYNNKLVLCNVFH